MAAQMTVVEKYEASIQEEYEAILERVAKANKALGIGSEIQFMSGEWYSAQAELKAANAAQAWFLRVKKI